MRIARWALIALAIAWSAIRSCSSCCPRSRRRARSSKCRRRSSSDPTLENYRTLWSARPEFFRALGSSAIVTLGAVLVVVCACTLAGYVYARYRSRLLSGTAFGMLAARMLPPIIITVPLFPILNVLRMNDTHLLLILLYARFYVSLGTWIMRSFVAQLPSSSRKPRRSTARAAAILCRVVLPLVVPESSPWRSSSWSSRGTNTCSR
jgi:multiple sugar transport system permease protein